MPKKLTSKQEAALIADYEDYWTIKELTIMYKISERTVYRYLADNGKRFRGNANKRRAPRKKKGHPPLQPCGTDAAYRRHKKKGEYPCTKCLAAHSAAEKKYRKRPPRVLKPCGTVAAYRRHKRKGEKACDKCLRANAKKLRTYRKKKSK